MLFMTQTKLQRSVADGRHHEYRCGHRQQHSDGDFRQRRTNGRQERTRGGALCRVYTPASGVHDRPGHDYCMLPMALAMGEGGEQNAPLGRAVIGGLVVATASTLIIVPVIYSLLRKRPPVDYDKKIDEEFHQELKLEQA